MTLTQCWLEVLLWCYYSRPYPASSTQNKKNNRSSILEIQLSSVVFFKANVMIYSLGYLSLLGCQKSFSQFLFL